MYILDWSFAKCPFVEVFYTFFGAIYTKTLRNKAEWVILISEIKYVQYAFGKIRNLK